MNGAYYNENDPFAAAWLRELIKAGLIADGEVDERSIELVRPDDLRGFVQCHFFAGIGGWSYALRLAGWPDDRAVWTGSCPCQPWSIAGKALGADDPRDLWYVWFRLIRERRPCAVFGEQVASGAALGWFDRVCADVEHIGYAIGAASLQAASVGAPHLRQRLWFVADTDGARLAGSRQVVGPEASRSRPADWASIAAALGDHSFGTPMGGSAGARQPLLYTGDDGLSGFVGRVRGYGNAIVPQVAQVFIEAYLEATTQRRSGER